MHNGTPLPPHNFSVAMYRGRHLPELQEDAIARIIDNEGSPHILITRIGTRPVQIPLTDDLETDLTKVILVAG